MNFIQKLQYYLILLLFRLLTLLPLKVLFLISEFITFVVYHVLAYRKTIVFKNLKNSFPEKGEVEIAHIARKYYRHLSVMMVENIYLRFISAKNYTRRIVLDNREVLDELYAKKRNIIIMLGHFGNWEFCSGLPNILPYSGAAIYKQLSSAPFDKIYFDIRSRFGVEPIEMKETFRRLVDLNSRPNPYYLLMIADQAPGDTSHWVNFLHQDTNVYLGSEKLARKFDMPVVYMEIIRHKKGIYRMTPHLITDKPKETENFEITERYFQLLEDSIKRSPRYWLWSHRRWKHKREKV